VSDGSAGRSGRTPSCGGPTASSWRWPVFRCRTPPEAAALALTAFIDAHRDQFGVDAICRTLTWADPRGGIHRLRLQDAPALAALPAP